VLARLYFLGVGGEGFSLPSRIPLATIIFAAISTAWGLGCFGNGLGDGVFDVFIVFILGCIGQLVR
jgi:hypothetical protein